jgi:hypothetical protein
MTTAWRDAEKYLNSLWLLDREDDRPLNFHGAFTPAVAEGLILRHTQPGDWLWDPMAGSGTTGLVAERLGRRCFMSDLTPMADHIHQGNALGMGLFTQKIRIDGAVHHLRPVTIGSFSEERFLFDLVILHPPYHNAIRFSDKWADLSNSKNVETFLHRLCAITDNVRRHLKPRGYVGLVIGDIWIPGEARVQALGFESMQTVLECLGEGAQLKAIVVKGIKNNQARARLRYLWSSCSFEGGAAHLAHEYIFSIQKGG